MMAGNVGMTDWTNRYAVMATGLLRWVPGMWCITGPHRTPPATSSATSVTARHHGEDAWAATAGVTSVPTATTVKVTTATTGRVRNSKQASIGAGRVSMASSGGGMARRGGG